MLAVDVTPPHDLEAEANVLGACLLWAEALEHLPDAEDFYRPTHAALAEAVHRLVARGEAVNHATVLAEVPTRADVNWVAIVGGIMADPLASSTHAAFAGRRVRDMATRRRVLDRARAAAEAALNLDEPIEAAVAVAQEHMLAVTKAQAHQPAVLADVVEREIAVLHEPIEVGLPSRSEQLTLLTLGYCPEELMVVGAHPGDGKTSFVLSESLYLAYQGTRVGFFSMEMSARQVARRALANIARVDSRAIRRHDLSVEDQANVVQGVRNYGEALRNIVIEDRLYNFETILTRARMLAREGVRVFAFDYLLKFQTSRKIPDLHDRVKYFVEGLSKLAKDEKVTVVALSQFTKAAERRPSVDNLFGGKAIEAEAHKILLLFDPFRAKYFEPELDAEGRNVVGECHVGDLCKNREGETGLILLRYNRATSAFEDWTGRPPRFPRKKAE